jgi:hypothetical protein
MIRKTSIAAILILATSLALAAQEGSSPESGLVKDLTSKLGVTEAQAKGGAAAVLGLAKHRMGDADFGKLSQSHPEIGALLKGAGNLNVTSMIDLTKQFNTLGLDAGLVPKFIPAVTDYFGKKGGDDASGLLKSALSRKEG